jgi:DNA-binding SARP family transcriptional activator
MIQLRVLGAVDVRADDQRDLTSLLRQPKRTALVSYLAVGLPQGHLHRRDRLRALFWPELDEAHARGSLNTALRFLRQTLGGDIVVTRGDEEAGLDAHAMWVDAWDFEAAMGAKWFDAAINLYRGDLLDGLHVTASGEYEEWLDVERRRLRGEAVAAATGLVDRALASGDVEGALRWARRASALAPDDERTTCRLIEVLDAAGDRVGALQAYDALTHRLRDDFGADPAETTRQMVARIRSRSVRLDPGLGTRPASAAPDLITPGGRVASPRSGDERPTPGPAKLEGAARAANPELPGSTPPRARSVVRRVGIALAGVVVLTATATLLRPVRPMPSSGEGDTRSRVAVFPFAFAGPAESRYLAGGVPTLLRGALEGAGPLRVVDPQALVARTADAPDGRLTLDEARRAARRAEADHLLLGEVSLLGARLVLSASVHEVDGAGDAVLSATVEGPLDSVSAIVVALARELLVAQPLGGRLPLSEVTTVSTTRLAALKAYLQGMDLLFRGAYDSARTAFVRAVEDDSTMAPAWLGLAIARGYVGSQAEQLAAADAALRYAEDLSERDRLFAQGLRAVVHGDAATARERARAVLAIAPDYAEGWGLLAEADGWYGWQGGGDRSRARPAVERAHRLDPRNARYLHDLVEQELRSRHYREADSLARVAYTQARGLINIAVSVHTATAVGQGDTSAIDSLEAELRHRDVASLWNAVAYLPVYTDDLAAAVRFAQLLTDPTRTTGGRASGHLLIALSHLAGGRREAAGRELADLARLTPDVALGYRAWFAIVPEFAVPAGELRSIRADVSRWTAPAGAPPLAAGWFDLPWHLAPALRTYWLGLLAARLGEREEALRHAAWLEQSRTAADSTGLLADLALEVRALVAIEDGRLAEALAYLERASLTVRAQYDVRNPMNLRPLGRYLRARLLQQLGREEEALAWYDGFAQFVGPEFVFLSLAYLRVAEIHERAGRAPEARSYYARFLQRWGDADASLQPLVAHARSSMGIFLNAAPPGTPSSPAPRSRTTATARSGSGSPSPRSSRR